MTDNLQLQTARLTNASSGALIADSLADIENCLRVIFKITADTPISQAMSITAGGDVTLLGDLTLAGAPSNALHAATKKYVDDATGVISSYKCKTYVGGFTISAAVPTLIEWDGAIVEDGSSSQWDSGDPTKIVCKSAGDYLITFDIAALTSGEDGYDGDLLINGATILDNIIGFYSIGGVCARGFQCLLYTLAEDDYIQLKISAAASTLTGFSDFDGWGGTHMSIVKVSD